MQEIVKTLKELLRQCSEINCDVGALADVLPPAQFMAFMDKRAELRKQHGLAPAEEKESKK